MTLDVSPAAQHLIGGLAVIGAAAGMAAGGTITGVEALAVITPVATLLLGVSATSIGAAQANPAPLSDPSKG